MPEVAHMVLTCEVEAGADVHGEDELLTSPGTLKLSFNPFEHLNAAFEIFMVLSVQVYRVDT